MYLAVILLARIRVIEEIISPLQAFNGVPGRFEVITLPNNTKAIVDYAHTPEGLYYALSTAKECIEHVFGFRGKRDISKREEMVKISQEKEARKVDYARND